MRKTRCAVEMRRRMTKVKHFTHYLIYNIDITTNNDGNQELYHYEA
jgi:hypothetical protein